MNSTLFRTSELPLKEEKEIWKKEEMKYTYIRCDCQKKNGIFWEFFPIGGPPPHPPLLGISKKIYRFFW